MNDGFVEYYMWEEGGWWIQPSMGDFDVAGGEWRSYGVMFDRDSRLKYQAGHTGSIYGFI